MRVPFRAHRRPAITTHLCRKTALLAVLTGRKTFSSRVLAHISNGVGACPALMCARVRTGRSRRSACIGWPLFHNVDCGTHVKENNRGRADEPMLVAAGTKTLAPCREAFRSSQSTNYTTGAYDRSAQCIVVAATIRGGSLYDCLCKIAAPVRPSRKCFCTFNRYSAFGRREPFKSCGIFYSLP